jgi:predicted nucleic acid-binding protein
MDARRCAQTLGIPMLGTGGLLVLAKRRGLLASVSEGIAKLQQSGLWLSDDIARILQDQAGE